MEAHTKVRNVEKVSPNCWDLTLTNGAVVHVFITDVYTFSVSDYALLRERHSGVNIIVSASGWNHFSSEAAEQAAADGVATVHIGGELMSVLHDFVKGPGASG
jgi:glyceraldehyde-3-phosphate dehydrogenase/erythrose-4-phosphate dehydrogenase